MALTLEELKQSIADLAGRPNVRVVDADEASRLARPFGTPTRLGSVNYASAVKSLSTALTVYVGSPRVEAGVLTQKKRDIKKSAPETVNRVLAYVSKAPLVRLDCTMGQDSSFMPGCRLYLSTYRPDSARLAYKVAENLYPPDPVIPSAARNLDLTVVLLPEWPERDRQVLVFPEIGLTFILGADNFGEVKNAFLRMAMWQAKEQNMLGLHAGTKIVRARTPDGNLRRLGMIMFGIAATGKTTHSCHDHGLDQPGEGVEIAQDDVVFWRHDGSALGTERALYIRTDGLTAGDQPLLHRCAIDPRAILENVVVDYEGNVYFDDRTLTPNGHAIAPRSGLGDYASQSINLPPVSELDGLLILFMVRDYTAVPIVSRLTPEQAAVAFMLSESIDAAGGEQQSGQPSGGIGASPFVIGDAAVDCNLFLDILKSHGDKIECYMLNTGGVGEIVEHEIDGARRVRQKVTRIRIPEMAAVIRSLARGTVTWREDPDWMVETPEHLDGIDISLFDLRRHYDQSKIDSLIAEIRLERARYAEQFPGLAPAIRSAVEF